jgi:hypothetical protein
MCWATLSPTIFFFIATKTSAKCDCVVSKKYGSHHGGGSGARAIPGPVRPSFKEVEAACRNKGPADEASAAPETAAAAAAQ